MNEPRKTGRRAVKVAARAGAACAALALVISQDLRDGAREILGFVGVPDFCTFDVDERVSRRDFRVVYVNRDEPQRGPSTIFDGGRCGLVPPRRGGTVFEFTYQGRLTCIASYFKYEDFALQRYAFECGGDPARPVCTARVDDARFPTSCGGWSDSEGGRL